MDYMLIDGYGNAVEAFQDRQAAETALLALVAEDHAAAHEVALLAFDSRGVAVGEPLVAADLQPESAVELEFEDARYRRMSGLTFSSWTAEILRVVQPVGPNGGIIAQVPLVA